jgi:hypothetical protein
MLVTNVSNKKVETNGFIACVKKYPEIFDTAHPSFKLQDDKNGAWEKIAREQKSDVNSCKKKFRTLRERYTRELRKSYLEPSTPIKFEYFKQLSFLNPYIKFRSIMFETTDGVKTVITKRDDGALDKNESVSEIKMIESDAFYEDECQQSMYNVQESNANSNIIYETVQQNTIPEFSGNTHTIQTTTIDRHSDEEESEVINIPSASKTKETRKRKISWNDDDQDEDSGNKYFAMSVACSLKRLSTINNLKAKVEIYQILEKFASKELD